MADAPDRTRRGDALPEGLPAHIVLMEEVLMIRTRPFARHQRLARLVADRLDAVLPPEWCTVTELDVLIEGAPTLDR